ncbi:MAG: hypothetical protein FK730_07575 [Asgard group archaeon]|nr:hypothetical protein [Asgard group archaeon]
MFEVNQEVIDWLLEDNNPPIKYLTLTRLLDKPEDGEIKEIKNKINTYKPIKEILQNQKENSYWFDKHKKHNYKKYLGTYWQLIFLNQMHAQRNEQIENAIEHVFATGQPRDGGFSYDGTNSYIISCLTANILRALIHFGYLDDERTMNALEYLLTNFVDTNGKIRCQPVGLIPNCYMTIPKILHAFSSIPKKMRTSRVDKGIDLCVERLLENQIFIYLPEKNREFVKIANEMKYKGQQRIDEREKFLKKYPNMKKVAKKGWTQFGFPYSYASDALDAMRALVSAEIKFSPNMKEAIDLIVSKSINGKWINENKFKSPMHTIVENYHQKSKWVTLHALEVLKFYKDFKYYHIKEA